MSPLANALRRLLGQPRNAEPTTNPAPRSEAVAPPHAAEREDVVSLEHSGATPDDEFSAHSETEAQALLPVVGAIEDWTRESGGWRILVTGPSEKVNRSSVLLRLADAIVGASPLGVLLVEGQSLAGISGEVSAAPSELIPGRVWFVTREGYFGLEESLCRPVLRPGETKPALVVLIDGGDWERLDREMWPDPRLVDALLDIRQVGDLSRDSRLDETVDSGVLPLLGIIEVPPSAVLA